MTSILSQWFGVLEKVLATEFEDLNLAQAFFPSAGFKSEVWIHSAWFSSLVCDGGGLNASFLIVIKYYVL